MLLLAGSKRVQPNSVWASRQSIQIRFYWNRIVSNLRIVFAEHAFVAAAAAANANGCWPVGANIEENRIVANYSESRSWPIPLNVCARC